MKIRRKLKSGLIILGIILPLFLVVNHFIILASIFYRITYPTDIQSYDDIVQKSELFDYLKYCRYRNYKAKIQNLSRSSHPYHIDREFLESLTLRIDNDKKKFNIDPIYRNNFIYSLEVSNESLIYLTYNNNTVIKAEYSNLTEIFAAEWGNWGDNPPFWDGSWYLNFTQIPFVQNSSSTIVLNNIYLVKMQLDHYQVANWASSHLTIEQFLVFNSNFQIIFVYIPPSRQAVS